MNRLAASSGLVGFLVLLMGTQSLGRSDTVNEEKTRSIIKALEMTMDVKAFQQPMRLREFVALVSENTTARGQPVDFITDREAFKRMQGTDILEAEIRFEATPKSLPLRRMLEWALAQADPEAAYLIRNGQIEITTAHQASLSGLLGQRVVANFNKAPLSDALQELSYLTGASIVIDSRVSDKAKSPVTALFRNDVTLDAALRMLTDLADLKFVILPAGLYVTTPANAEKLEKELRDRGLEPPSPSAANRPSIGAAVSLRAPQ